MRALLWGIASPYSFLRVQSPVTALLGPQYRRSRTHLEIDLTWSCNLLCHNCNRSCSQAPTSERMDVDQITRMLNESTETGQRWEQIRLLGGEPTLHPEFSEILDRLLMWRRSFSPETRIEISSNGYGSAVQRVLEKMPSGVVVNNTNKVSRFQQFQSFNVAPVDSPAYIHSDYSNGCLLIKVAGVGFTPYGWYPCPIAGGIDRIMGLDLGMKQLPAPDYDMHDQLRVFCRLCGHFKRLYERPVETPIMSETWREAYARYREEPPELTRY